MTTRELEPGWKRFAPLGFELHYRNMRFLGRNDVIVASLGGAGQSLLGNLLVELGLPYINLYNEVLLADGTSRPEPSALNRRRFPAMYNKDSALRSPTPQGSWRFMKTHLPAEEFTGCDFGAVWLLVRDPRDAIYSWYHYHRSFASQEWEKVDESFEAFLSKPFFGDENPVDNWCSFYTGWLRRAGQHQRWTVLRFEDLKQTPHEVMGRALRELGVRIESAELDRAIQHSSFAAMRAHEDRVAVHEAGREQGRIMRSGKVAGWKEWMTPPVHRFFQTRRLAETAERFGYPAPAPVNG